MALIKCPECKKMISDQCENCPQCGYPIKEFLKTENNEVVDTVVQTKNPFYKKIWFWVVTGVVLISLVLGTILLINRDTKPKFDKDGKPIFVELTSEVYTNAEKYLGYHTEIKGKVFQVMSDNGNFKGIQIWLDPDTCEQNLMIYYNTDVDVKQGDYIVCSGYIDSVTQYKNAYDAKLYAPLIISSDLKKATYIDVMAPATETITSENLKQVKYGYSISIDKIEFAEKETRIYVTATNNGKAILNIGDAVIVQDGKQYNSQTNYDADYEKIPYEIVKGVTSSGIIVFPVITTNDFELTIDAHSDDYDEDFDKFNFQISKNPQPAEKPTEKPKEEEKTVETTEAQPKPTVNRKEQAVTIALNNANDTRTPNDIKAILAEYGFSSDEINYAVYGGYINWQQYISSFIYSLNFEAEEITVTNCTRCYKRYYGKYDFCQGEDCGGGVNWSYYHGYSRAVTINKLLNVGYSQNDIDSAMRNYEYGTFIDEIDFSDCIVVE